VFWIVPFTGGVVFLWLVTKSWLLNIKPKSYDNSSTKPSPRRRPPKQLVFWIVPFTAVVVFLWLVTKSWLLNNLLAFALVVFFLTTIRCGPTSTFTQPSSVLTLVYISRRQDLFPTTTRCDPVGALPRDPFGGVVRTVPNNTYP